MYEKPVNRFGRIIRALALTVLLGSGVFCLVTLADKEDTKYQSTISEWPIVTGRVMSTVRIDKGDWDDPLPALAVRFEYEVKGVSYHNSQDLIVDDYEKGEKKYPLGSSATVHYDPAKPNRSLISTTQSTPWQSMLPGVIACYLMIFTFCLSIYLWGWWVRGK